MPDNELQITRGDSFGHLETISLTDFVGEMQESLTAIGELARTHGQTQPPTGCFENETEWPADHRGAIRDHATRLRSMAQIVVDAVAQ